MSHSRRKTTGVATKKKKKSKIKIKPLRISVYISPDYETAYSG